MKRKLIDFDVFKKMESESLSNAEFELSEAEDVLARALNTDSVSLHCFGESDVLYTTPEDTYIHATYQLEDNAIILENIEELVVDEEQERKNAKALLANMIEEIVEGNDKKAENLFEEYLDLSITKRLFTEGKKSTKRLVAKKKKVGKNKWKVVGYEPAKKKSHAGYSQSSSLVAKRAKGKRKGARMLSASEKKRRKTMRKAAHRRFGFMKEEAASQIAVISENVLDYVNYLEVGPVLKETSARYDENGNVVALRIPTSKVRNEGKILSFNWKTLNTDLKLCRDAGKNLAENMDFCKAVSELKRQNAFNNSDALEESLESIVVQWPDVIYLTQKELAKSIKEALEVVGVVNYDDQTCDFMAEGILRTAHSAHTDRVEKVLKYADKKECKEYECFQEVVSRFYPQVDENTALEMQVFYDLYTVVGEIYKTAQKTGDEILQEEAEEYVRDLAAICEGEVEPDINLAAEVAEWAYELVEANVPGAGEWNPSNSVHHTVVGDHPDMAKKATVDAIPSKFKGDWDDEAPVSDGKTYGKKLAEKMRSRAWSNVGGPDTYPSLNNPYVPKPFGDYTLKGEPGVDKNSDAGLGQVQGQTWPSLENPYVPKAETPQSYKMNKGKEQDLVVDK